MSDTAQIKTITITVPRDSYDHAACQVSINDGQGGGYIVRMSAGSRPALLRVGSHVIVNSLQRIRGGNAPEWWMVTAMECPTTGDTHVTLTAPEVD